MSGHPRERGQKSSALDARRRSAERLAAEAEDALTAHLVERAEHARRKYGRIDAGRLPAFLNDPECVRHPARLVFEEGEMAPHQFAQPDRDFRVPGDGARVLWLRPELAGHPEWLPLAVAYMVPVINYGEEVIDDRHCLRYAAVLLGLDEDAAYRSLCGMADALGLAIRRPANHPGA